MFMPGLLLAATAAVSARKCNDLTVPVSLTAENAVFDIQTPETSIDVTNFLLRLARSGENYPQEIQSGTKNVTGDYLIAATYCEPDAGPSHNLQVLTHGIGFDRSYWDLPLNNYNYSYAASAVDEHGYSTLSWDRLGVGHSSHGDALSEMQIFLEVAALHELTNQLSAGALEGVNAHFDKIVHVGHSFGSVMSYALANMYPDSTDAIVLTGFSHVMTYVPYFALGGSFVPTSHIPALAPQYPRGYIAPASEAGAHINFFAPGDFDQTVLAVAHATGQPASVGEILTLGTPVTMKSAYTGPVLVITGEHDVPFCGGNCYMTEDLGGNASSILDVSKEYFPRASSFNATVVPGAGHGLNLGYSHVFTYSAIHDFLSELY